MMMMIIIIIIIISEPRNLGTIIVICVRYDTVSVTVTLRYSICIKMKTIKMNTCPGRMATRIEPRTF